MDSQVPTYEEIRSSKGMKFSQRMEVYSLSHYCFEMNTQELVQTLEKYSSSATEMIELERRKAIQKLAGRETARHFHNCVASAKSLVEHTRIFVNKHYAETPEIFDAYQKKVKDVFAENGNAAMIEDLRNFFLHAGVPPIYLKFSFGFHDTDADKKFASAGIYLHIDDLKSRGTWKSASKKLLSTFKEDIILLDLIVEYRKTVENFHTWFSQILNHHHVNDMHETNEMISALEGNRPWPVKQPLNGSL